jgi:hypothetical protein
MRPFAVPRSDVMRPIVARTRAGKNVDICKYPTHRRFSSFFDKSGRDWNVAWQDKNTPWETGSVSPGLKYALENGYCKYLTGLKHALVPGCGSGHDCEYLRSLNKFDSVVGLDMSPVAIDKAREMAAAASSGPATTISQASVTKMEFICGSYFDHVPQHLTYELIFDYLFFSALDIPMRKQWAQATARLLTRKNGVLITKLFPLYNPAEDTPDKLTKGPPYLVRIEDYESELVPLGLELVHTEQVLIQCICSLYCALLYWYICRFQIQSSQGKVENCWRTGKGVEALSLVVIY